MTILRTQRLTLCDVGLRDCDAVHAMMSDHEVVRRTGTWPWPPDPDFTASRCVPVVPADGFYGMILLHGAPVGFIGVKAGVLGYALARDHWGRGYATEIGRAVVAHAFASYDWPRITACVFDDNPTSVRVLEKLGFVEGAPGIGQSVSRGGDWPMRTFALSRPATP